MSRSTRRLALRATLEQSRARGLEAMEALRQIEVTQSERRIDALAAAGQHSELERAFRIAAITNPRTAKSMEKE